MAAWSGMLRDLFSNGTVGRVASEVITLTDKFSWSAAQAFTGGITGDVTGNVTGNVTGTATTATRLKMGAAVDATIASGVLTITSPFTHVLPESGTTDTVDSIVYAGAEEGDVIVLVTELTNTITYDDAALNLAATTRACAPGGSITLFYDGEGVWTELTFAASGDHA
jgi:hypothetical protein